MKNLVVVAMISGKKKNGSGNWYKVTLKGHNSQGNPVVNDFFVGDEVGEKAVKDGIIEDCPVTVSFDFDDYMRPTIVGLTKVSTTKGGATA